MRIYGFDMDGVLAEQPPPRDKKWGLMNGGERRQALENAAIWYRNAKPLFAPHCDFHVITARKDTPEIRSITEAWLGRAFGPRVLTVQMLTTSRTIEKVSEFKSEAILNLGVTDFHEDNPAIVRALRKILKGKVRVYLYKDGVFTL